MEITLNLFQLIVTSINLIGITVIFMTHLFIKYLLKHYFENVNISTNNLHIKLLFQQKDLLTVLIYWLMAMTAFMFIPKFNQISFKCVCIVVGIIYIIQAVYCFPKFWKISLKPPTQKS